MNLVASSINSWSELRITIVPSDELENKDDMIGSLRILLQKIVKDHKRISLMVMEDGLKKQLKEDYQISVHMLNLLNPLLKKNLLIFL